MNTKLTVFILFFAIFFINNVALAQVDDTFLILSQKESVECSIRVERHRRMLRATWHGMEFYLDEPGAKAHSSSPILPVDREAYGEALTGVSFPLSCLSEYRVCILPYRLLGYPNTLALTLDGNTTYVFATTWQLTHGMVHRLAVHELGHAVDFRLMTEKRWAEYRKIRGLTDTTKYRDTSPHHKDRPREVFAEDFRLLFGGELAAEKPHENPNLLDPQEVPGLKDFFLSLVPDTVTLSDENTGANHVQSDPAQRETHLERPTC